jgi:hypothetical protein
MTAAPARRFATRRYAITDPDLITWLTATYGWTRDRAHRVVAIAAGFGVKAEATTGGLVLLRAISGDGRVTIEDHTGLTEAPR